MEGKGILVYAQAVPVIYPSAARAFSDLSSSQFRMTHSSKTTLAAAQNIAKGTEIVVAGFHSILQEALARGASEVISVPLCSDPLEQAKSLSEMQGYELFLVGENPDGPFSGAALCGALSALWNSDLEIIDGKSASSGRRGKIVLVRDDVSDTPTIDVRRIKAASDQVVPVSAIIGNLSLTRPEQSSKSELVVYDSPRDVALAISRRLRRLTGVS